MTTIHRYLPPELESLDGTRSQLQSALEETEIFRSIPFHGTCPNCEHFHKYRFIAVPVTGNSHVRVACEACGHHIVGLGRTDTQFSLASVESFPLNSQGQVEPIQNQPNIFDPAPSAQDHTGAQRTDSSESRHESPSPFLTTTDPSRTSSTESLDTDSPDRVRSSYFLSFTQAFSQARDMTNHIFGFLWILQSFPSLSGSTWPQLGGRSARWTFFGWQLSICLHRPGDQESREVGSSDPPSRQRGNGSNGGPSDPPTAHELTRSVRGAWLPALTLPHSIRVPPRGFQSRAAERRPYNLEGSERRREHLAQMRHEKTLQRNALSNLHYPNVTEVCRSCQRRLSVTSQHAGGSNDAQSSRDGARSVPSQPVPRHPLEHLLAFTGVHHNERAEDRGTHSTRDSGQANDSISQATTVAEGSEISLQTRRPTTAFRSNSSPAVQRSSLAFLGSRTQTSLSDNVHQSFTAEPELFDSGTTNSAAHSLSLDRNDSGVQNYPVSALVDLEVRSLPQVEMPPLLTAQLQPEQSDDTTPTTGLNNTFRESMNDDSEVMETPPSTIERVIERLSSSES